MPHTCYKKKIQRSHSRTSYNSKGPGLQGLAIAAATREAAKRKREPTDTGTAASDGQAAKLLRPIPVVSHEVAVPKGYDEAAKGLDPALHGEAACPDFSLSLPQASPCCTCPIVEQQ